MSPPGNISLLNPLSRCCYSWLFTLKSNLGWTSLGLELSCLCKRGCAAFSWCFVWCRSISFHDSTSGILCIIFLCRKPVSCLSLPWGCRKDVHGNLIFMNYRSQLLPAIMAVVESGSHSWKGSFIQSTNSSTAGCHVVKVLVVVTGKMLGILSLSWHFSSPESSFLICLIQIEASWTASSPCHEN